MFFAAQIAPVSSGSHAKEAWGFSSLRMANGKTRGFPPSENTVYRDLTFEQAAGTPRAATALAGPKDYPLERQKKKTDLRGNFRTAS
jgi:hypothetical protein